MLSRPFYLLLTISIVTKCANAYVLDGSVPMNNAEKSQTNDKQNAYSDDTISSNSDDSASSSTTIAHATGRHAVDNQSRTFNASVTDNSMEMPKPNDAIVDATTFQTSRQSRNTLTGMETGKLILFTSYLLTLCSWNIISRNHINKKEQKNIATLHPSHLIIYLFEHCSSFAC